MKSTLILFLSLLSFCGLAQDDRPIVIASASMIADMASRIAGDQLDVKCIVPIGGDPHMHEPTPGDAKLVSSADLIIINGLTFEGWIKEVIESTNTDAPVVVATNGISPISSDEFKKSTDPHAWMDVSLALTYIRNIRDGFIQLLPEQQATFEANYEAYKKELEELDQYIEAQIKSLPEKKRILITSHDAFQYYGQRYGIRLEAVMGTSTDADVQTSDIIRLSKIIEENQIPAVFVESTINPKLLKQLAKDNKISVGGQLYADSIGDEDSSAPTYIDMMRYNTNTIVEALKGQLTGGFDKIAKQEDAQPSNSFLLYGLLGLFLLVGIIFVARKINA
ncbi:MAG: zinc ABC transporter substrate-binding protein [Bacteroidota bacterium]